MTLSGTIPAKAAFMFKDLTRASDIFQVKLTFPSVWPANTMQTQRFLIAVKTEIPEKLELLTQRLFERHFGDGLDDISTEQGIKQVCVNENIPADQIKKLVLQNTTKEKNSGGI